jgi:hypothetical protein
MYRIEVEGSAYLKPVKKFSVSHDCMIAALVMENNQILTFKVSYFLSFYFFLDFRK